MEAASSRDDPAGLSQGNEFPSIRGMESVIASVSGYHGTERFKLIKLIARTGANYVGVMARSTTHLVCWQLEGKKFDLAREFGTIIVSHRWFEDCLKEGRRLPEGPYTMQSGQETGSISCEVPDVLDNRAKRKSQIKRERSILSDQSNVSYDTLPAEINKLCPDVEYRGWSDSTLLKENSSATWDTTIKGSKKVRKTRQAPKHSSEHHSRPPVNDSCSLPEEASSSFMCSSSRQKRNLHDASGNNVISESARRSHRLVKKNAAFDIHNCSMLDYKGENRLLESCGHSAMINSELIDLDNLTNRSALSPLSPTSENMPFASDKNRTQGLDVVEEVERLNKYPSLLDSNNTMSFSALSTQGTTSHNEHSEHMPKVTNSCFSGVNPGELLQEGDGPFKSAGAQTQAEVSCAICWTEFCSTRGVLPCGHRFCYSCIKEWADCMASKGKVSTCPLCKTVFTSITKFEESASHGQKIYSQTIPCGSSNMDIPTILDGSLGNFGPWSSGSGCYECHNREPEDLLVNCHICQLQRVHICCLDPPMVPWTCIHCRDLRMLYQRYR